MQTRNLLAEKDVYQLFESTLLRHQVVSVREVTSCIAEIIAFGRNIRIRRRRPVAEKPHTRLLQRNPPEFL